MHPSRPTVPRPLLLLILDGFGISFQEEGNAILAAKMEHLNRYLREYPCGALAASGNAVGLPENEAGNSETGHKNMGSGRIIYQPLPQISRAIENETFFENPALLEAVHHVQENPDAALHLMGCLSTGGVHSHIDHLIALLELARRQDISDRIFIHAFLDGRDVPPVSAGTFLEQLDHAMRKTRAGTLASIIGRYYAMDRNTNWDRTKAAYDLLVHGIGQPFDSWQTAMEYVYEQHKTDENVPPLVLTRTGKPIRTVHDGDAVIFFNFRPDRSRQLSYAFVEPNFRAFPVQHWKDLAFVTMAEFEKDLPVTVAFPEEQAEFPLGRMISDAGLRQLRIAETEKYAHVTYYFNSGRELPYPGEDRVLVPSPNVKDFTTTPRMSAGPITDRLMREMVKGKYDFLVANYANPDMLAHTGNFDATVTSLQFLDEQIERVIQATLAAGGAVLLTCDHGNAENMIDPTTKQATTDHSHNLVPIISINRNNQEASAKTDEHLREILSNPIGVLADVGPTCLEILGIPQPPQMTQQSVLGKLT